MYTSPGGSDEDAGRAAGGRCFTHRPVDVIFVSAPVLSAAAPQQLQQLAQCYAAEAESLRAQAGEPESAAKACSGSHAWGNATGSTRSRISARAKA